ncbi:tetratricopeptide repeat protein [Lentzea alba]|uniref:tetratricopeptide repeat protein n=1 Tax=Lentzea alba TaxID=2714351 RepID=UPI0039BF9AE4
MSRHWWRSFAATDAVASILLGAVVGAATNILTGDNPTTAMAVALAVALLALAVLALRRVRSDLQAARAARRRVLIPLLGGPPPPPPGTSSEPTNLIEWLSAKNTPTRMWGRSKVLTELTDWCLDDSPGLSVTALIGDAAVGKTRLVVELARKLPDNWYTGRAITAVGVAEAVEACGDPCLVLVDDADLADHLAALVMALAPTTVPVRLVLCSRSPTAWRPQLPEELRHVLTSSSTIHLTQVGDVSDLHRWYWDAVRAYAEAWKVPAPPETRGPVGGLADAIGVIQIRALLTVLGHTTGPALSDLLEVLWQETANRWSADTRLPATVRSPAALAEIVAAQVLQPAATVPESAESLRRLPRFASTDTAVLSAIAEWTHDRLPKTCGGYLDLHPQLLAEHLLRTTVSRVPALIDVGAGEARRLGTLIARMVRNPENLTMVEPVLKANPAHAAEIVTAVFEHAPYSHELDSALVTAGSALTSLTIPHPYVQCRCAQLKSIVNEMREHSPGTEELAVLVSELAERLQEAGNLTEAVAHQDETVRIARALATNDPSLRNRQLLALQLQRHCALLTRTTKSAGLLTLIDEAEARTRDVLPETPEFRLNLVDVISARAFTLRELGRFAEAFTQDTTLLELTIAYVHDNQDDADGYRRVANTYSGGASTLRNLDRIPEAAVWALKAVDIFRFLHGTDIEKYNIDLVISLLNLNNALTALEKYQEALDAADEALMLLGLPFHTNTVEYADNLATTLGNRAFSLRHLGRHAEALQSANDALAVLRKLHPRYPDTFLGNLARALQTRAIVLRHLDRHEESLWSSTEALTMLTPAITKRPELYTLYLAEILHTHAVTMSKTAPGQGAMSVLTASLDLLRGLPADSERITTKVSEVEEILTRLTR